jgi:hypothetical protein
MQPHRSQNLRREEIHSGAIARLKPGLSVAQVQSKLDAFAAHLRERILRPWCAVALPHQGLSLSSSKNHKSRCWCSVKLDKVLTSVMD